MPLLTGQPLTAKDVERETSSWPPELFVSLCNDLSWAVSGRAFVKLPSYTTRINASDGGIDAEVEVAKDGNILPTPIVGPGWNVFQYKKVETMAQDRRRIVARLKSRLKGTVQEIKRATGRYPDHYVVFINLDLLLPDTRSIRESVLASSAKDVAIHVEVVGAALLASILNDNPHLRAAYFAPLAFKTWEESNRTHFAQKPLGSSAELTGRDEELSRLRWWIDDPRIRLVVLSGAHDAGKTRLALEATRHRQIEVVVAVDPDSMTLSDYQALTHSRREIVCVVDDPNLDAVGSLIDETLGLSNLKLVITVPAAHRVSPPSYGVDRRFESIHLERLSEEASRRLLKSTGISLDFGIEDWIVTNSGGLPGVLLAAASVGTDLRRDGPRFSEAVGRVFVERIESDLSTRAVDHARLLSLLTHVGVSGVHREELDQICSVFGEETSPHRVLETLPQLEDAGLARRRGSFAEITVPLVGRYLARQLIQDRAVQVFVLFKNLSESGRRRLIQRIAEAGQGEFDTFWNELFAPDGPFGTLESTLNEENAAVLKFLAAAVPDRVLRLLEHLHKLGIEERRAIRGAARRELMWALEQILFRTKTSARALRLIWLLAEAENETYGNNATGILEECFYPRHQYMPLPLAERLALLREFTSASAPLQRRLVAILAAQHALDPMRWVLNRHSSGPDPLDSPPPPTLAEAREYAEGLMELYFKLAAGGDAAAVALEVLPAMVSDLGTQLSPASAAERFKMLVAWAREGRTELDIAGLVGHIRHVERVLSDRIERMDPASPQRQDLVKSLTCLVNLRAALETREAPFALRLKNWTGAWASIDPESLELFESGGGREIESLAVEAVCHPERLTHELTEWLLSPAAERAHLFFHQLGLTDHKLVHLDRIDRLGRRRDGVRAFSFYVGGWSTRDADGAEAHLDVVADKQAVSGNAIIQATTWINPRPSSVRRIVNQIKRGEATPQEVESAILARWLENLAPRAFEEILRALARHSSEYAIPAVRLFGMWMHFNHPIDGTLAEFAWQCLEAQPQLENPQQAWYFDRLAARLSQDNPERGFELLGTLILETRGSGVGSWRWDPLERHASRKFWTVLYSKDKLRLYCLLLDTIRTEPRSFTLLSWRMGELIDYEQDHEVLLSLARNCPESARTIAGWMHGGKAGFWPLVFALHQTFPQDEDLHEKLAATIERRNSVFTGEVSQFHESIKLEVEQKLQEPSTPVSALCWLREIADRLSTKVASEIIWEYDLDVDDLRTFITDRNSPQRIWAIGRVLKYAKFEDLRQLLTVEDIEQALPQVDLPEEKRRALEQAIPIWQHGR